MKVYPITHLAALTNLEETELTNLFSETLIQEAKLFMFDKKEYIVRFEQELDHLFYLLEGRAKIYKIHENGGRSLIQFLGKGDFIGELSLLEVEEQVKDVQTIDQCICLALPYHKVKERLLNDPAFLRVIANYLGQKLLSRVEHFSTNQQYELKYRLAAYMLQTEVEGIYSEKHTETAEFLGVSYRHLIHTLTEFQKAGLVVKQGRNYRLNQGELMELAVGLFN